MSRRISLAHLTVLDLPPPQMVKVAAYIGYDSVGLRLIAVTDTTPGYPLMGNPEMMRETKAVLRDTGLAVMDIEFVRVTPDFDVKAFEPFLAAGAELGAAHVICAPYDADHWRLSDSLAAFADLAGEYKLCPVLEFFPWTSVPDLGSARHVVEQARRESLGILVDTLHFDRSGSRLADLDDLDRARLPFAHVCDAPVKAGYTTDELLHAGRAERLPPGQGEIDIRAILAHLPSDIPIALEVPMTAKSRALGSAAVASEAFAALRQMLAS